jgi:hypothetical protein
MAEYMLPYQPSLASATNTRLDTAARHMQQCRVSTDDMMRFVEQDAEELQRNKFRYCVHKDELAIGVGRPWNSRVVKKTNNAYPRIVSNLGALGDDERTRPAIHMIRFMNHFARNLAEKRRIIAFFDRGLYTRPAYMQGEDQTDLGEEFALFKRGPGNTIATKDFMPLMHDFVPVGYATTLGYAHPNTGDTMSSILIGGLITVMNGDFEIFAGDLVQFYWCFEKDDFEPSGRRKPYLNIWLEDGTVGNVDPSVEERQTGKRTWSGTKDSQIRQAYHELSYGQKKDKQKLVGKIKPYIPDDENPRLYDWVRVFGMAIACARPNEMVDIKISRQSM